MNAPADIEIAELTAADIDDVWASSNASRKATARSSRSPSVTRDTVRGWMR